MAYPNGTMGCPDPAHRVGKPPPEGLGTEDHIAWVVDHAPPLSEHQRERMAALLPAPDPVLQIGDLSCPGE